MVPKPTVSPHAPKHLLVDGENRKNSISFLQGKAILKFSAFGYRQNKRI
jgi:hypothetical protein